MYAYIPCVGECVEKRNSGIVFPIDPVFSESVKTSFTFLHKSLLHVEENPSVVQPSRELCHNTQIEFGSFPGGEYSSVDVTGKSYSTGDNISPCKGTEKVHDIFAKPNVNYTTLVSV